MILLAALVALPVGLAKGDAWTYEVDYHYQDLRQEIDVTDVERLAFRVEGADVGGTEVRVSRSLLGTRVDGTFVPPPSGDAPEETTMRFGVPATATQSRDRDAAYVGKALLAATLGATLAECEVRRRDATNLDLFLRDRKADFTAQGSATLRLPWRIVDRLTLRASAVRMPDSDLHADLTVDVKLTAPPVKRGG